MGFYPFLKKFANVYCSRFHYLYLHCTLVIEAWLKLNMLFDSLIADILGQTWFSCSLYSFHSEQAEQKSSALEHLRWRTPEYSVFRGGVDRTVTLPVPKKMADHCLHARKYFVSLDLFQSIPKCPVLLVYVAVLAYVEYSKIVKSSPPWIL